MDGLKTVIFKIKELILRLFNSLGYNIIPKTLFPKDMDVEFREIYHKSAKYSICTMDSMYSLYKAVEYIVKSKTLGDFVECGVWKGGSCMIIAHTLMKMKETNRKIYLYDTFEGMSKPTKVDMAVLDNSTAIEEWKIKQRKNHNIWCFSSLDEVKKNMLSTGYPEENLVFVKGKVEDTIPNVVPHKIALLRLDTDWYESAHHELTNLFPLLTDKGVLIIDDYGTWTGSKKATDEYIKNNNITILLNRVGSCRLGIKLEK